MPKSTPPRASRPGGRSSRVKSAVFAAVESMLVESPGELPSMTAIAERAGVNPSSLYRRWREARLLAAEVAVDRMMRELPVPDTGSLREDLVGWAVSAARSISTRRNVALIRVMAAAPSQGVSAMRGMRNLPIGRRMAELEAMLARAAKRGERTPSIIDVLELVLAPIYLHALFLGPISNPSGVDRIVDRALALAQR
jgi:AcrR family transcriptional regulator